MNQPPYRPPNRMIPQFPGFPPNRPPGTPAQAPARPRLPQLPASPYIPPQAPPAAPNPAQQIQGLYNPDTDNESALIATRFHNGVMTANEHVYTTSRRWRGIDVFINIDPGIPIGPRPALAGVPGSAAISVQLWAIDRGVRTLVATGRYGAVDQIVGGGGLASGDSPTVNKRLIAYRGGAEKFEVTAYANWSIVFGTDGFQVGFGIIATDQVVPVDDDDFLGCIPSTNDNTFGVLQVADAAGVSARVAPDNPASATVDTPGGDNSPIELVWIFAATSIPARWLQVFATPPGAGPLGRPVASFSISQGDTQAIEMPKGFRFRGTGFSLVWSSTAATHTATGVEDSGAVGWFR